MLCWDALCMLRPNPLGCGDGDFLAPRTHGLYDALHDQLHEPASIND